MKRWWRSLVVVLGVCSLLGTARAQGYPTKPVRIIVPLTAGGLVDVLARTTAQELAKLWGQQVLVENRPGANTIIASELVAKSAPDGYTLMLANPAAVTINGLLSKKLPYDPERDFTLVYNFAYAPTIIVVAPTLGTGTLADFVALAKGKPGEINYGSFGIASATHIDTELFASRAGIRMNHVPYKGVADVLPAVATGQIQMGFAGIPPSLPLIKQGRVKALAVNSPRRSTALPDVPTLAEAGFPGLNLGGWFGFVAPAGTPKPIVDKIAADLERIASREDFREKALNGVGLEPLMQGPEQFAEFVRDERARYAQLIRQLKLSLD